MSETPEVVVVGRNQEIEKEMIKMGDEMEVINVEKDDDVHIELPSAEKLKDKAIKKFEKARREVVLPEIGTQFSIGGQVFKVTYINEGRKRLSVEPVV